MESSSQILILLICAECASSSLNSDISVNKIMHIHETRQFKLISDSSFYEDSPLVQGKQNHVNNILRLRGGQTHKLVIPEDFPSMEKALDFLESEQVNSDHCITFVLKFQGT
jgi:hypothetical protein